MMSVRHQEIKRIPHYGLLRFVFNSPLGNTARESLPLEVVVNPRVELNTAEGNLQLKVSFVYISFHQHQFSCLDKRFGRVIEQCYGQTVIVQTARKVCSIEKNVMDACLTFTVH
jgi:hypothetical protein